MLYYCKIASGNFGDDLNPWLWSRLAPEVCQVENKTLFVGIGTILTCRIPVEPIKMVFGSGCWGHGPLPRLDDRWKVYCVRGPLTAARLGLDPQLAVVDPGILVRRFIGPHRQMKHRVSFMPHQDSLTHADWGSLCQKIGFHCIDPRQDVETVLQQIQETGLLLTEAMHGAIAADALRVPWIPVRLYSRFNEFKWEDWCQSVGTPWKVVDADPLFSKPPKGWKQVNYAFKKAFARAGLGQERWKRLGTRTSTLAEIEHSLAGLQRIPENHPSFLSDERRLGELEDRLMEKLSRLRADWPNISAPSTSAAKK